MRGQATVAIVVALSLGGALALLVAEQARLAVERAHAQRAADAAALAAALEGPFDPDRQRAAADRAATRAAAHLVELDLEDGRVRVLVRLSRRPVALPALLGGGSVGLAASARPRPRPTRPRCWRPRRRRLRRSWCATRPAPRACPRRCWPPSCRSSRASTRSSVSSAGAQGIAQFMPGTWSGAWNPWRLGSPFDPAVAIRAQARLMAGLLRQFGGDVERALAGYNAGPGRARQPPASWPAETRAYVPAVLALAGAGQGGARLVR